jgi:hypothetical protein
VSLAGAPCPMCERKDIELARRDAEIGELKRRVLELELLS